MFCGKEDTAGGRGELRDGLTAGSAGLACNGGVFIGDGNGNDADAWAALNDGACDGGLLCAGGEAVAGVFDVAAGDDVSVVQQKRCANVEVAVGCVGVFCGVGGLFAQAADAAFVEVCGFVFQRHRLLRLNPCAKGCKRCGAKGHLRV